MATVVPVREVGWRAEMALRRTLGRACVLAVLSDSRYLTVAAELGPRRSIRSATGPPGRAELGGIEGYLRAPHVTDRAMSGSPTWLIWLGLPGAALHGRATMTPGPLPDVAPGEDVELDTRGAQVWQPRTVVSTRTMAEIRSSASVLIAALPRPQEPPGFGALLAGMPLVFPLERAAVAARALAEACVADDADAAVTAAAELVGLGPGLTPAGDDFVGGAFFARARLTPPGASPARWARAAAAVVDAARERTHPISHALLADLASGHGHAPLHDLANALAAGAPLAQTLDAALRVTRIGHSSGWDMLAGFLTALAGC